MKKADFLIKLKKEGRLEIIEPSEEIKQAYLEKSRSNLISSKILLENNKLEESVGLAYYSMYHSLTALLFRTGIKSENHTASIDILKDIFEIDNSDIAFAKRERIDKQYYVDFNITKEQVKDTINKAELFNSKLLEFISRLSNKAIEIYRKRFISSI
ncbi:HEPN domain-containing protein [Candidatus Pacearchaeota archaeon]|nr:HEPN domain-containing protein [Candidatus Pacearchaeota archaeon]